MIEKHKTKNVSKGLLEDIHESFHASLLQYTSAESTLYVFPIKFLFALRKTFSQSICFNWHLLKPEQSSTGFLLPPSGKLLWTPGLPGYI